MVALAAWAEVHQVHQVRAADVTWINSGDGSFTTGSNWNTGTVPGTADLAVIGNGGTATLTLAGTAAGSRLSVGQDGVGTMIVLGGGTVTTTGISYVGRTQAAGAAAAVGTLVIDGSTTLRHTTSGEVYIGVGSGTRGVAGSMTVNAGSVYDHASGGTVYIGQTNGSGSNAFTGSLTLNGGAFTIASNELVVGQRTSGTGTVVGTVTVAPGGTLTVNNWTKFGSGGGTGRLVISGGSVTKGGSGNLMFGDFNGRGEVTQTGGTLTNTAGALQIGAWGSNGVGVYDLSSGTLATTTTLAVGSSGGNGTLNVSGGVVRKTGAGDLEVGTGASGRGTINVSGGLVDVQVGDLAVGAADGAKATLNLSGGEVRAPTLVLGKAGALTSGTVNLNAGTLRVNQVSGGAGAATSAFVFNGGTLAARADQTSFMAGIGSATIAAGGAVIDTQGSTVIVPQVLSGSGGLTKAGAGSLSLTGANAFTGPVAINGGRLVVTTAAAPAGSVTLSGSTTLGVTVAGALNSQFTTSAVTLGSAAALTIDLASFGNPTLAPLNVSGALTTTGASTINFLSSAPTVGTIPLVSYGSLNAFSFTLGTLPAGVLASLSNNTASKTIDLVVTSVALPRWDGTVSDVWNVNSTANWVNTLTGSATTFQNGNPALFNDLAAGSTDVQLNSTVLPGLTTFANETRAYSLGGTGAVNGTGGLTKQGAAVLSLNTVNGYTGVTRLEGGTTSISIVANAGLPSAIGAASADPANLAFAGGDLAYAGSTASTTRGFSVVGPGSVIDVASASTELTFSGNVAASAGQFRKAGPGTLVLAGTSNTLASDGVAYGLAVDAGTLRLAGPGGSAASQTSTITGELRVGALIDSSAALEMTNATLNVSGWMSVGFGQGATNQLASATLTNSAVQASNLRLGYDDALFNSSAQTFTMTTSAVAIANEALIANSPGSASVLTLQAGSTFTAAGTVVLGSALGSSGTAVVGGGSLLAAGDGLYVGDSGLGSLAASGSSTVNAARLLVGQAASGVGTMTVEGDARVNASIYAAVGNFGGGTLTLRDRSALAVTYDLNVADRYVSSGTMTVQDRAGVTAGSVYVAKGATTVASLLVSGGTVASSANGTFAIGRNGTGGLVLSGSGVVRTGTSGLVLAANAANPGNPDEAAAGIGSLELNGGLLETTVIRKGAGATATMSLNGGTIRAASGATAAFLGGLDNAVVLPGGVTFDTNGQSLTVSQSLADGGGGGLVKLGSGTLSLTGLNTYSGATDIVGGKLAVQTTSLASGGYTLGDGTKLGVMVGGSGTQLSAAAVTMTGTVGLDFDLAGFGNPTLAPLNVLGILTAGGPVTISVSGVQPAIGQIPLVQYGSKTGAGTYTLAPLTGYTASLLDTGTSISLNITAIAARQWNGLVGSTPNGTWNVGATSNWLIPPTTASTFANGDAAVFNDSAAGTTDVVLAAAVSPSSVTIDNTTLTYGFSGTGAISGTTSLTKLGAGTVTMSATNTYTGATTVAGGRFVVRSLANGGAASPVGASSSAAGNLVLAGGTLAYTGSSATVNRGFTVAGASGGAVSIEDPATTLTVSGNVSGTATLILSGSGTLRLSGSGVSVGPGTGDAVVVRSGTLAVAGTGTGAAALTSSFSGEVVVGSTAGGPAAVTVTDATLNASGFLAVGRATGAGNAESIARLTRASVTAAGLAIGSDGGVTPNLATQSVAVVDASLASGGDSLIGDSAGSSATLTLSGSSTFRSDNGTRIGNATGAVGRVEVRDTSSFTTAGWLAIGNSGSGSFVASDRAVVTVPVDFNVADLDGSQGRLEISGQSSISAASTYLGKNGSAAGVAVMTGGTFASSGSEFIVGRNGSGSWTQSGGQTSVASEVILGRFGSATGSLTVSGGSFVQAGTDSGLIVGFDGAGSLTVSGSGSVTVAGTASGLTLGNFTIGSGTVALDGGTLTVPYVRKGGTAGSISFNGGVLRAGAAARNDFLSGLDSATVLGGGAAFDTNGVSVTVSQSLADGGGGGGFLKQGAGTLVLAGNNAYTGPTTITAGTLSLSAAGSIASSASVAIGGNATFDVTSQTGGYAVPATQTLAGNGTVNGAVAVASGATLSPGMSPGTLSFTQGVTFGGGGNYNWQMLSASGTAGSSWDLLSVNGPLTVAATSAEPFAINLWTLAGVLPDVSGSAANFDPGQSYSWRIATAAGGISGFAADKFTIRTSATNGTGGFANGLSGGTFSIGQSGNDLNLVFTSSGPPTVITINVASGTQTQTQAGYPLLSGSIPVVKTGAGTLVLTAANTLTGSTTVQGGVVQLADGSALASSRVVPVAGGTLTLAAGLSATVGGLAANAGGLTDVGNGMMTVAAGLSTADMLVALGSGRGDGSWNGTSGITSSAANAALAVSIPRTMGWLDNGDGSVTFAFAAPADTNLDWQVDILDAANFLAGAKFDTGLPATWNEGDFGYDGVVDILDAADFLATNLFDAGPYNSGSGQAGIAAVPEPSSLALLACLGSIAFAAYRRR